MLSTSIGKGYIILINDKSLWGKYVLRNADFRFSAQIRSHFLLHQEANHHRYFEGQPYFLAAFHRHTNNDILWDIPSILLSLICQQLGTLLGTSLLFCCCTIGTQIVTQLGISHHFRLQHQGTLLITSNLSAIVLQTNYRDTFCNTPSLPQAQKLRRQTQVAIAAY